MNGHDQHDESDLERRLRRALHEDASSITPSDRSRAIQALAAEGRTGSAGRSRWLAPVASAAAVAVVATLAWGATGVLRRPGGDRAAAVAASSTPVPVANATADPSAPDPSAPDPSAPGVVAPAPSPISSAPSVLPLPTGPSSSAPTVSGTSTVTATTSPAQVPGAVATLPVYLLGSVGNEGSGRRYGLFRQFVSATVAGDATAAQKAQAALSAAVESRTGGGASPYLRPWGETTVEQVTLSDHLLTIDLSGGGSADVPAEQSRLAVQQLVWTATAAVGDAGLPVRFRVAGGATTTLFGTYPTGSTYSRPAADASYQDLAPIWVERPATGTTVATDGAVVASGTAAVFEGNLQWRLSRSGAEVTKGFATASTGAPGRGTWTVDLGRLPAGTYTFSAVANSAEDGRVQARDESTFSVR
jgi:Immunoglobulin-like domain of bacterial spore germination/Sporulation and spore germination